ncbi:hypothetical protein GDO86_017482 [Hymenochirus boettgeri]|uniref:Nucleoside diphosphate kinase-like domain-containing protein n=1 Tax=Hymenochirus boettgeri TaxID=247094 RepID=A0A8T2IQL9_9PIPI|nr:hypothetical protein GDO86_017482 [Hymenochirus boettgeri]
MLLQQLCCIKNIPTPSPPDANVLQPEVTPVATQVTTKAIKRPLRPTQKTEIKRSSKLIEKLEKDECRGILEKEIIKEPYAYEFDFHYRSTEMAQREKQEKQKVAWLKMQTQLEGLKPCSSVNGHQPMAEDTPILFHPDASYSPKISPLPASAANGVEMLLLTILLSSCGQVMISGQHGRHSIYSSLYLGNTFNCLLAWLLSLVPSLNTHAEGNAPFNVVGIQQAWREEGLALYACLTPRGVAEQKSPKIRRQKGKEDLRGTSSFYQQVSLYLSQNTLQSVTWWSDEVTGRLHGKLFPLQLDVPAVRLSSVSTLNPAPEAVEKVFHSNHGFYWQTMETEEKLNPLAPEISSGSETQVVSVIVFERLLSDPAAFHHALHMILTEGLDICGLRLLHPQATDLCSFTDTIPLRYTESDTQTLPVLAMALRGTQAEHVWGNISGPFDPCLARLTDPCSLNAIYGFSRCDPIIQWARKSGRLLQDLSLWFGGRITPSGNFNIGIQNPQYRSQSPPKKGFNALQDIDLCRPTALLTATTLGDVFLVVSPSVSPLAYGDVLNMCFKRGFALQGLRRLRVSAKRAAMLNMSPTQVPIFCPIKPKPLNDAQPLKHHPEQRLHCLLLLLRKENVVHHTPGLIQALMNELAEQGLLGVVRTRISYLDEVEPALCFHISSYSDSLLQGLGGNLFSVPDASNISMRMLSLRPFVYEPEDEQVVVLTISGRCNMKKAGKFLRQILRPIQKPFKPTLGFGCQGFEILGLKMLPNLSRLQAKEITPYEVGDRSWQRSVENLISNPALLCALRRSHAFHTLAQSIKQLVPTLDTEHPQLIMSATPEVAFRQAVLIFTDGDLIPGTGDCKWQAESIFTYMISGPPVLYTVLLLKPHYWGRVMGKILRNIYQHNFHLVGMKPVALTPRACTQILPDGIKKNKDLCQSHCDYLTSAPCLVICLQRHNAVLKLLNLLGPEDPELCKGQDQHLWRAQFGTTTVQNGMYGSTSYQAAIRDIQHFFPEGLICEESTVLKVEQIPRRSSDTLLSCSTQRQTVKKPLHDQETSLSLDLPYSSALCQTTCLLFPPHTVRGSPPTCVQGLEQLAGKGFHITGARLTVFDQTQAQQVAELYNLGDHMSTKCSFLNDGPCLLVAAQRDNAVSCFTSLMDSVDWHYPPLQTFTSGVLCPHTESQANKMLSCFFDILTPESIHQISPRAS